MESVTAVTSMRVDTPAQGGPALSGDGHSSFAEVLVVRGVRPPTAAAPTFELHLDMVAAARALLFLEHAASETLLARLGIGVFESSASVQPVMPFQARDLVSRAPHGWAAATWGAASSLGSMLSDFARPRTSSGSERPAQHRLDVDLPVSGASSAHRGPDTTT
jgi:hypothetical protein